MQQATELKKQLQSIHRKSYPAYKSLKGSYQFGHYILSIDHVQGDPFASPSHISVHISRKDAGFPDAYSKNNLTCITLADHLTRQFEQQINHYSFRAKGSGKSGLISVSHCGQEILSRTACEITSKGITARFFIGFPANGRTINAPELEKILFDFLPCLCRKHFLLQKHKPGRTGTNHFSRRRSTGNPGTVERKKTGGICCRWCYTPTRKWYFLPSDEAFCPVYFSGIAPYNYESSA